MKRLLITAPLDVAHFGALIASHQADGNKIILQLDANTTSNTSEWWDLLETHNLVDLHGIVSLDPFPNSFASGTTKIDYILGTPKCAKAVRQGGICNFVSGPHSDHRGMYIDFDASTLFSEKSADPTRPTSRQLHLGNKQATQKYLEVLHLQLEYHNAYARVANLPEKAKSLPHKSLNRGITQLTVTSQQHVNLQNSHAHGPILASPFL